MARSCEDCGSRVDSQGRCSNCHEELIINDDQMPEFPVEVSDEWKERVAQQRADVKERRDQLAAARPVAGDEGKEEPR